MKAIIGYISAFIVLLFALIIGFGSWGTVSAGHRGVLLRNGAVTGEIKPEGFYFKAPWIDSVTEMDVRTLKEEVATDAASKDLQTVTVHLALNHSIQPEKVATIYQTIGT